MCEDDKMWIIKSTGEVRFFVCIKIECVSNGDIKQMSVFSTDSSSL